MIGIRCARLWNYVELFWNSLDNAPSSIVFYLEMKVEVEECLHDTRPRFTPRFNIYSLLEVSTNKFQRRRFVNIGCKDSSHE